LVLVSEGLDGGQGPAWLVEQRYGAVLEVLGGSPISEVAVRYGVSRQAIYTWKAKHEADGLGRAEGEVLAAEVEALACEMRRANPRWGARRIA
jgi:transposase